MIVFSAPTWIIPVLVLRCGARGIALVLVWAPPAPPPPGGAGTSGCGLLKLAGVIALALCLLDPMRVGQRARPGANLFALIADNSQSMQVKDAGQPQSRGEILRAQLTNDAAGWQSALAENFQLRRYTFDSQLQDTRDFEDLKFDGRASALREALLHTAADRWRGQPVAGVLLFTDGNATGHRAGPVWPGGVARQFIP